MTNISSVPPISAAPEALAPDDEERTIVSHILTFSRLSDGRTLSVSDGDALGRSGETLDFFKDEGTVSRRHAKVGFCDGTWLIVDLGSTNGTWVNGERIQPGQARPLKDGDSVALSQTCEMRVIE
jgi:pSer/pThr/pTyr-binding forkhead associated (FHA) protein